ncbi:MAG TPA: alpha/beta hydrolase [Bryobacteraceae bacterium]|nr:alpha/beta hydrolase [Bryobacteraceae bacterium]
MRTTLWIGALATIGVLYAHDIGGDWQGTLKAGPRQFRLIMKIEKGASGGWNGLLFSIDQVPDRGVGITANSVTLEGSTLKFTIDAARATYEGEVSADGASIKGTWTQGQPLPLEFQRATPESAWKDPSPHRVQLVTADTDIRLEVLDWGGSGRPVVLLAGLGNTAHIFDKLAPKLTANYHVYGITRRGSGASSAPATGYSADRLGDDVLAVLESLKLDRPVLAGHSIAGEELSSVASRHPERVAGLIYLDAGYSYAYYDRSRGDLDIDLVELQKKLEQLQPGKGHQDPKALVHELLETTLPGFERDLREREKTLQVTPAALLAAQESSPLSEVARAIRTGEQKYINIPVPILAIYAVPHDLGPAGGDGAARAAFEANDEATTGAQAKAFERGVPSARIVRLPHANHYVFLSNEADVLREMNAFLGSLP